MIYILFHLLKHVHVVCVYSTCVLACVYENECVRNFSLVPPVQLFMKSDEWDTVALSLKKINPFPLSFGETLFTSLCGRLSRHKSFEKAFRSVHGDPNQRCGTASFNRNNAVGGSAGP